MFRFQSLHLENFRCFDRLELRLEDDLTVLFAENGGGKTALLNGLAMGLAVFQPRSPKRLKLDALRDTRKVLIGDRGQREPAGPCRIVWSAVANQGEAQWSVAVNPASGRRTNRTSEVFDAIEAIRVPGEPWPLFAWYGTDRLKPAQGVRQGSSQDRWDGYAASLDPDISDAPLLDWLRTEILGDVVRQRRDEPERRLDAAVMAAMVRATPDLAEAWFDPVQDCPIVRFEDGHIATWSELSDGFHVFLALVGDIARRAVMLNQVDGNQAPELVEGIVLVDEIDLHLHPRWQRVVLDGLLKAFPKLQFVVTTHSPQVLSSAKNRQVRRLLSWRLPEHSVLVEGRDSNAILRELMSTDDRDAEGTRALRELHDLIDQGSWEAAKRLYEVLLARWGDLDPALIRARALMDWEA
ncbi:MAG: AAA family ATPase [bacterium]|nr:AAA family ATPase [bacterium]